MTKPHDLTLSNTQTLFIQSIHGGRLGTQTSDNVLHNQVNPEVCSSESINILLVWNSLQFCIENKFKCMMVQYFVYSFYLFIYLIWHINSTCYNTLTKQVRWVLFCNMYQLQICSALSSFFLSRLLGRRTGIYDSTDEQLFLLVIQTRNFKYL